ncbi:MAG: sensor histidine kinase [Planctomycetes bacterium]|nr:sensor histidine kinase [Planctomycetota bacterium]
MFGAFIVGCGFTHFMEVLTFYTPIYRFSAVVKVATALISLATVAGLIPLIPKALALRSPEALEREIQQRIEAEERAVASLREKEVMLKEIHHRVKNNLAVVSSLFYLQSAHTKDEATIRLLKDSQDRVRSMALVHETLYRSDNLAQVDFAQYAGDLARSLFLAHQRADCPIDLKTQIEPATLTIEQAVPCGLILNELLTNALKHAFLNGQGGQILLGLRKEPDGALLLSVRDNGVGIPDEPVLQTAQSLGLRLIHSLCRQIDGQFEFVRHRPGTEARLLLKIH